MNTAASLLPNDAPSKVAVTRLRTPIGVMHVASLDGGVCAVAFDDRLDALELKLRRALGPFFRIEDGDPHDVGARLAEYFAGRLDALSGVPLATAATPMQRAVWALVRALKPGELTTYAALSDRLGMPRAQRAVGVCLASSPVPVLVPCHRVIAASGGLGSHPGGLSRKTWLLRHEGVRDIAELCRRRTLSRRLAPRDRTRLDPRDAPEVPVAA